VPLTTTGSPLVAGMGLETTMAQTPPKTVKVRVLRAFHAHGKLLEVDSTPTLEFRFALEMRTANKVEFLPEGEAAASPAKSNAPKAVDKTAKET
jgi:hypothetical protein